MQGESEDRRRLGIVDRYMTETKQPPKSLTVEEARRILDAIQKPPQRKPRRWYQGIDFGEWLVLICIAVSIVCLLAILIGLTVLFVAGVIWALMWMF